MVSRLVHCAAAALVLALAGCGGTTAPSAPLACPRPTLLADGADLTRYRPGPVQDLTTLEWDARLSGLSGGCSIGRGNRSVDMSLTVAFTIERGPSADSRTIDLPWFVAVVDGASDAVLSRQSFVERVNFGRNETRANGQSQPVRVALPVTEGRRVNDYRVMVSFELTPEDLALNRRRGQR